jgi:hypothetical protein
MATSKYRPRSSPVKLRIAVPVLSTVLGGWLLVATATAPLVEPALPAGVTSVVAADEPVLQAAVPLPLTPPAGMHPDGFDWE